MRVASQIYIYKPLPFVLMNIHLQSNKYIHTYTPKDKRCHSLWEHIACVSIQWGENIHSNGGLLFISAGVFRHDEISLADMFAAFIIIISFLYSTISVQYMHPQMNKLNICEVTIP